MAGRIGIITGLAFEAELARAVFKKMTVEANAPDVRCVGMGAGNGVGPVAAELAAKGVSGLISFGVAGGLDPSLRAGRLVIPEMVVDGMGGSWPVDTAWRAEFLGALGAGHHVAGGTLLACGALLISTAAKADAHRTTGAGAADMESGKIAVAAQETGMKLLVVRAVADEAGMALPPAATAMGPDGALRWGAVVSSLVRQPAQVPDLVRLGLKSRTACTSLRSALGAVLRSGG